MDLALWLLDVGSTEVEGRPEVRLWGIDERGRRVLLIDRGLLPTVYLLPAPGASAEELARAALADAKVAGAKAVDRRWMGKPVRAARVEVLASGAAAVARVVKRLSRL